MKKKQILLSTGYIILLFVFLLIFGFLSSVKIRPSENDLLPLFLSYLIYSIFGALLGLPKFIKAIKASGKIKFDSIYAALAVISFAFLILTVIIDTIHPPFHYLLCNSWYLVLILLGYSLINVVRKEPAAQISE